jgi:hypothetical protein
MYFYNHRNNEQTHADTDADTYRDQRFSAGDIIYWPRPTSVFQSRIRLYAFNRESRYRSRCSDWLRVGRQRGRSSNPDGVKNFHFSVSYQLISSFSLPNLSSPIMAPDLTQPLTEISTRIFLGDKGRPARKANNLTVICE